MDVRKIVVIVEEKEAAKTALKWALNNLIRYGDLITLLHVFPSIRSKNKSKTRLLRLSGYQLALSFKDLCHAFPNTKVEIIVTEGDQEGRKITTIVREIEASALVVGLHDHSFLYKVAMGQGDIASHFNCRVLAIKQPTTSLESQKGKSNNVEVIAAIDGSTNMDFSQIEIAKLQAPEIPPPKIPYRICPDPSAIIWRSKKSKRKWTL